MDIDLEAIVRESNRNLMKVTVILSTSDEKYSYMLVSVGKINSSLLDIQYFAIC